MGPLRFVAALEHKPFEGAACWFVFRGNELLVRRAPEGGPTVTPVRAQALKEHGIEPIRTQVLGTLDGEPCFSGEVGAGTEAPEHHSFEGLRSLFGRMDRAGMEAAGTAFQIKEWDRTHQHCGACGGKTTNLPKQRAKHCEACRLDFYPRVSPALIVLVHDGPRVLLARQPGFPPGMFALVAGFLEAGETLEACAAREVLEETGIVIDELRYFGSQPWPFPHQVMVGFFARAVGGELQIDHEELEDAAWFDRDNMPALPPRVSISRQLIDAWLSESGPDVPSAVHR